MAFIHHEHEPMYDAFAKKPSWRKARLQLFDEKNCATGDIVDVLHCAVCGALVFDMATHEIFHARVDRAEKGLLELKAVPHNWDLGGR